MSRNLTALHPVVQDFCTRFLAACRAAGLKVFLTQTLRSSDEQAALFAQGRMGLREVNDLRRKAGLSPIADSGNRIVTKARTSVHEFGCAFDVALRTEDGDIHWDRTRDANGNAEADYDEIGLIGEGIGLTWGGRFSFADKCHFQYTGGLSIKEMQAGARPALSMDNSNPPYSTGPGDRISIEGTVTIDQSGAGSPPAPKPSTPGGSLMKMLQMLFMFFNSAIGRNVTDLAARKLNRPRPWYLSRRFTGALIVVAGAVLHLVSGLDITDTQIDRIIDTVDQAVPVVMGWGLSLSTFGLTNRGQ